MTDTNRMAEQATHPEPSTSELVKQLTEQVSALVREELRLAQLELTRKGMQAGMGAGLLGGAGLIALFGGACLIACAVVALSLVLPTWLATLIVGACLLIAAGILTRAGRARLRAATPPAPTETAASVKADVTMIKEKARR